MHNLEVFAAKVCNKITLQGSNPSELLWDIYFENLKKNESGNVKNRKKKSKFSENLTNLWSFSSTCQKRKSAATNIWSIEYQCCPHIETSQLIFCANQLTGFYMRATLAFNVLIKWTNFGLLTNLDADEWGRIYVAA